MVIAENNNFFNRFLFVKPNETIDFYNKRHLFTLANEHLFYTAGKEKVIINYLDWRICLQVCYDLRFPVFSRNQNDYDMLIYVANWPKTRINAWDALIKARAIENMSCVVGVNRIGEDDNKLTYVGHSQVVNALGDYLLPPFESDEIKSVTLHKNEQNETREKLPFLNDSDDFQII
jgi:predicted amidohydrolase